MISLAVMAHPSRVTLVNELLPQLPAARVVFDEKSDRWDTGRRSMLAHDPAAVWHLVVQDDAVLAPNFVAQASAALRCAGPGPVAFYMGRSSLGAVPVAAAMRKALHRRASWILGPGPLWGVAVAVRVRDIAPMVAWGDEHSETPNYDLRMAEYFATLRRPCWYSVPSLANHRIGPDNPSLVPGRGSSRGRTAFYFAGSRPVRWTSKVFSV